MPTTWQIAEKAGQPTMQVCDSLVCKASPAQPDRCGITEQPGLHRVPEQPAPYTEF